MLPPSITSSSSNQEQSRPALAPKDLLDLFKAHITFCEGIIERDKLLLANSVQIKSKIEEINKETSQNLEGKKEDSDKAKILRKGIKKLQKLYSELEKKAVDIITE